MKSDVSLKFQFTNTNDEVWDTLTDPEKIEKWIWKNDFKPVIGHIFQFRAEPNEWWDGIVDCEVLEIEEPHKLAYTWASAGESTTVTWTLCKLSETATQLQLEQNGFSEATKERESAIEGAIYSWTKMAEQLEKLLERQ